MYLITINKCSHSICSATYIRVCMTTLRHSKLRCSCPQLTFRLFVVCAQLSLQSEVNERYRKQLDHEALQLLTRCSGTPLLRDNLQSLSLFQKEPDIVFIHSTFIVIPCLPYFKLSICIIVFTQLLPKRLRDCFRSNFRRKLDAIQINSELHYITFAYIKNIRYPPKTSNTLIMNSPKFRAKNHVRDKEQAMWGKQKLGGLKEVGKEMVDRNM